MDEEKFDLSQSVEQNFDPNNNYLDQDDIGDENDGQYENDFNEEDNNNYNKEECKDELKPDITSISETKAETKKAEAKAETKNKDIKAEMKDITKDEKALQSEEFKASKQLSPVKELKQLQLSSSDHQKLFNTAFNVGISNCYNDRQKQFHYILTPKGGKKLRIQNPIKQNNHLDLLSSPKGQTLIHSDDEYIQDCTFKPRKSEESMKAFRNKNCKYDFHSKLENNGHFMDRYDREMRDIRMKVKPKSQQTVEEMEFNEHVFPNVKCGNHSPMYSITCPIHSKPNLYCPKHPSTNLQCPKCKKMQSYHEHVERIRMCTICKIRFTECNVYNAQSWERRQLTYEQKRLAKLAKYSNMAYREYTFQPKM